MGLFHRPDGTTIRVEIENGVGKIWVYDANGKCIRRPLSERIARARSEETAHDSSTEEKTPEGESGE